MTPADRQARVAELLEALGCGPGGTCAVVPFVGGWVRLEFRRASGERVLESSAWGNYKTEALAFAAAVSELEYYARVRAPGVRRMAAEARRNAEAWEREADALERLLATPAVVTAEKDPP